MGSCQKGGGSRTQAAVVVQCWGGGTAWVAHAQCMPTTLSQRHGKQLASAQCEAQVGCKGGDPQRAGQDGPEVELEQQAGKGGGLRLRALAQLQQDDQVLRGGRGGGGVGGGLEPGEVATVA